MSNNDQPTQPAAEIAIEDLRTFDVDGFLEKISTEYTDQQVLTCDTLHEKFEEEAKRAAESSDFSRQAICNLFASATDPYLYHFCLDCRNDYPERPPSIIDENKLLLAEIASDLSNLELKSRVSDICWTIRVNEAYKYADMAVDAYCASALQFDLKTSANKRVHRIERALLIATESGNRRDKIQRLLEFVKIQLEEMRESKVLSGPDRIMKILLERKLGNPGLYASHSQRIAVAFENQSSWEAARDLWQLAEHGYRQAGIDTDAEMARLRAARTYEAYALQLLTAEKPHSMAIIYNLKSGFEALRRAKAPRDEIGRVHKLLLERQRNYDEYAEYEYSVDVTELATAARDYVTGADFFGACIRLANMFKSPSKDELYNHALASARQSPLVYLVNRQLWDDEGRQIARYPSINPGQDEYSPHLLEADMFQDAQRMQKGTVFSTIIPALQQIRLEHSPVQSDLKPFVLNNPFVPPGRERIYGRGLHAGFHLDFMVAAHLLFPQIENSIRFVLGQLGETTSGLDSDGNQIPLPLARLLDKEMVTQKFGKDLVFDLRGLLISKFGSNLRNSLAHGRRADQQYMTVDCVYLWALVLRLCCLPIIIHLRQAEDGDDEDANPT